MRPKSEDHVVIPWPEVKADLQLRIRRLVGELLPGGHYDGSYYFAKNPMRDDKHKGSLWVRTAGTGVGVWQDMATMEKAGNVFTLIQTFAGLADLQAAGLWSMSWLGMDKKIDRHKMEAKRKAAVYVAEQEDRLAKQTLGDAQKMARAMFLKAEKIIDTPVETYLATRGIDLSVFDRMPGSLRYLANCRHRDVAGAETFWPCMLAAMCDDTGQVVAVHRTWLSADGKGKAPVAPNKKIWPSYKGAVIRLARGQGQLTPEEMMRRGRKAPLVVCEGIEDGLTLAMAAPEYRVWAAGTLGNMANVPLLACVSELILFRDNDLAPEARAAFKRISADLARKIKLRVAHTPERYKDANDFLRGIER